MTSTAHSTEEKRDGLLLVRTPHCESTNMALFGMVGILIGDNLNDHFVAYFLPSPSVKES